MPRDLNRVQQFFLNFIREQLQEASLTRKQKDELKTRWLEQLPMMASVLMEDSVKNAVSDAMEILDACANAIEEEDEE